jgi:hypothetical protein
MGYLEFLEAEFGKNWVVARRSESIVRRYGEDVTCLSQQRYAEAARRYRRLYGDPHDAVRRELYQAALEAYRVMPRDAVGIAMRLSEALQAEANAG